MRTLKEWISSLVCRCGRLLIAVCSLTLISNAVASEPCACEIFFGAFNFSGGTKGDTCAPTWKVTQCSAPLVAYTFCSGCFNETPTWPVGGVTWDITTFRGIKATAHPAVTNLNNACVYAIFLELDGSASAVDCGTMTVTAIENGHTQRRRTGTINITAGQCSAGQCSAGIVCTSTSGHGSSAPGSLRINVALGRCAFGKTAGTLSIHEEVPDAILSTPACLQYNYDTGLTGCEVITNAGGILQVLAEECIVNVEVVDSYQYNLVVYQTNAIVGKTNGVYELNGTPLKTLTILNPDEGSATDRLQFIDDNTYTSNLEWRTNGWELLAADNSFRQRRSLEVSNGVTTSTWEIKNASNELVACWVRKYETNDTIRKLVEEVTGAGDDAETKTYEYYSEGTPSGLLRQVNRADGAWEINEYDDNRLLAAKYVAFQNQAPTTNALLCRKFTYSYGSNVVVGSGDQGKRNPTEPRLATEHLLGKEIGRRYMVHRRGYREDHVCLDSNSTWITEGNLTTITTWYTNGIDHGRRKSIRFPDGTMEIFQYAAGTDVWTNIVLKGYSTDGVELIDGVKTVTVTGMGGRLERKEWIDVTDTTNEVLTARELYSDYDGFNRPRKVTFLDGTYTWNDYGCCGPVTQTARDGTETENFLDGLRRQVATKNNSIMLTNVLDAQGMVLRSIRVGNDNSQITQASHGYDTAGKLLATTNALGDVTTFTEWVTNNYLIRKTTYPDASTREETYYRDGQLAKVTGSAVHGKRYVHGVMEVVEDVWHAYTAAIKLDETGADTGEVVTNLFNFAGRNYKTLYGDGSYRETVFNSTGQRTAEIDPDGVTTLYDYNDRGDVEHVALDMDQDQEIDFGDVAGDNDRVTGSKRSFAEKGGKDVGQAKSYSWLHFDSASATLIGVEETTTDGLTSWSSRHGVTNRTDIDYPAARNGNRYATVTAPDGSYTITHFLNGVVQSVTTKDSGNNQLSQTVYTYDAHGRQSATTDARTGTTIYSYDDADRRSSVTTPAPGTGEPAQITSYEYDEMGRLTTTTYADGTIVVNEYHPTGELKKTVGSRTYPVEYKYDSQGRMTNMITWRNYAGDGGKATTRWQYDAQRGWMTNKVYEGQSSSVAYDYTDAGRLQKRRWEGGTWMTNTLNNVGDVIAVNYSDGDTAGLTYNLDRSGRRTNIIDAVGSRFRIYSDAGQLLSETHSSGTLSGLWFTNTYDSFLRRNTLAFYTNSGSAVFTHSYGYGEASRLTNASDGTYSATYSYLANSPLIDHINYRENSTTRMTRTNRYDYLSRLQDVAFHPSASGEKPTRASYTYNQANQRIRVADAEGAYWLYDYDGLGQLTSGKRFWADGTPVAGQQFEYEFDDIGNRQTAKAGGNSSGLGLRESDYSVNPLNQYTSRTVPGAADIIGIAHAEATVTVNGQSPYRKGEYYRHELALDNGSGQVYASVTNQAVKAGATNTPIGDLFLPKTPEAFTYDSDGNLTSDGRWTNRWDGENRLISMETLSAVPTAAKKKLIFSYDQQGRRISKTVSNWNGSVWAFFYQRKFIYDDWNMIGELDGNHNLLRSYLWSIDLTGSMQGAGGVGGLVAVHDASEGTHLVCFDGNGNVTGLIDGSDGTLSARYEYDPFGRTIRTTGTLSSENSYRFSTKYVDDESGCLYYGYRYYNPETGRWLNRDPVAERASLNLYSAIKNSTANYYDNLGLQIGELCGLTESQDPSLNGARTFIDYEFQLVGQACDCGNLARWAKPRPWGCVIDIAYGPQHQPDFVFHWLTPPITLREHELLHVADAENFAKAIRDQRTAYLNQGCVSAACLNAQSSVMMTFEAYKTAERILFEDDLDCQQYRDGPARTAACNSIDPDSTILINAQRAWHASKILEASLCH